jgi:hypothetical protein
MAEDQEKAADKGDVLMTALTGNFAPDAQLVVLERIRRGLEEKANKALEELRVIRQLIAQLKDDQFLDGRRKQWAAEKESQRNGGSPH